MEAWRQFLAQWPIKTYDKGQMLLLQGDAPEYCLLIREGFVKTYLITADGAEKPISFEGRHDIFPIDILFGDSRSVKYFYEAYTKVSAHCIPRQELLVFIREHPRMFYRISRYLVQRTLDYREHISSLEQAKAIDKLARALQLLTHRFGKKIDTKNTHMTLPLTQQDMANFLGLTRETTGAQLKKLEHEGVLRYHRQNYIINTQRLTALLANS